MIAIGTWSSIVEGQRHGHSKDPQGGPIGLSPDGKTLATCSIQSHGGSEILLWHTAEDETAAAAQGHDPSTNPAH